jgi:ubiquinone biosynthesis protein
MATANIQPSDEEDLIDRKDPRKDLQRQAMHITKSRRLRTTLKVFMKHGIFHLLRDRSRDEATRQKLLGQRLRMAFEELGPTFIKLGQVMLTRQELLPAALTDELEPLLSEIPPVPFVYMETVLDDNVPDWREFIEYIDPSPIGSASLAQVYQGWLKDGRMAAIKIVRPLVDKLFQADISVIRKLVGRLQKLLPVEYASSLDLTGIIDDYYSSSEDELDMQQEAATMEKHRKTSAEFATVDVPQVYYVSKRVLVMEYVDGWNLKEFPVDFLTFEERLERMTDLAHYYVKMFLQGDYHADPHGSNIMIDRHTKKAFLLDWGMTGRMDTIHTEAIFRMLLQIRVNQAEDAAEVALDIYEPTAYTDAVRLKDQLRSLFIHYTESHQGSRYNWGNLLFSTILIALKNHCRVPNGLALWAKGFSAAEGTARWLCPEVSYHDLVETADVQILRHWMTRRFNYRTNASFIAEVAKLLVTVPRRINKILENTEWNRLQFTINAQLSPTASRSLQRITNRVAVAFLSGALFLGSSLLLSFGSVRSPGLTEWIGGIGMTASAVLGLSVLWSVFRWRKHL